MEMGLAVTPVLILFFISLIVILGITGYILFLVIKLLRKLTRDK